MKFLLDENLARVFADVLGILTKAQSEGLHQVVSFLEEFQAGTSDVDWISRLSAQRGKCVVVSGDSRIKRNRGERAALQNSRLNFFFLPGNWPQLDFWRQIQFLIKVWPDILAQCEKIKDGQCYDITSNHKLTEIRN